MDPITLIAIPGFIGGVLLALILFWRNRTPSATPDLHKSEPLSTDVINMASIRVAGIGGLGLVAMAVVVAIALPGVGRPLITGLLLGIVFGALLIAWRRRAGPMPSSGRTPGANTTLSIDAAASGSSNTPTHTAP